MDVIFVENSELITKYTYILIDQIHPKDYESLPSSSCLFYVSSLSHSWGSLRFLSLSLFVCSSLCQVSSSTSFRSIHYLHKKTFVFKLIVFLKLEETGWYICFLSEHSLCYSSLFVLSQEVCIEESTQMLRSYFGCSSYGSLIGGLASRFVVRFSFFFCSLVIM